MGTPRTRLLAAIKGNPALVDRLLMVAEPPAGVTVNSPESAAAILVPMLAGHTTERLVALAFDRKGRLMGSTTLTTGSDAFTVVCPKQVYRWALMQGSSGASSVIIAHNHPSGDPTPSAQDREVTRRVKRAGEVIGIPMVDHIVVAGTDWSRVEVL